MYSERVSENVESAPRHALPPYKRLRDILSSLKDVQVAAEGAAPHLVDTIEKLVASVKKRITEVFSNRLRSSLDKLKWPGKDLVLNDSFLQEWADNVDLLLEYQEP